LLSQLTPEQIFDSLAIRVNGPESWNLDLALDMTFADSDTNFRLTLRNGVLVYRKIAPDSASATVTLLLASKLRLLSAAFGDLASPGLELSGDESALQSLLGVLDAPDPSFNIITP
jgi:alkyl sulfatase BDS1-like metallo-beta-lactamase superfamily hydrolase